MIEKIRTLYDRASSMKIENSTFLKGLTRKNKRLVDGLFHSAHEQIFENTDCLKCANCCKTLGPRLTDRDIDKLARFLKVKAAQIINTYLRVDEDGDLVFRTMPCPFLMPDNYCKVYKTRPKACREYPHTNRTNIVQTKSLLLKNSFVCPAVFDILELVKQK